MAPTRPPVPLALKIIAWLSLVLAGWLLLLVGAALLHRTAWLTIAGPVMLVAAGWAAALAFGLFRGRQWARHCAPALFGSVALLAGVAGASGLVPPALAWRALAETGVFGLAAAWFFYRKREVVAYFRALADIRNPPESPQIHHRGRQNTEVM